jgi:hypothetical protein
VDGASILGPAARVGTISPCACAFFDESLAWVLRKSLFYACTTSACNSPLLKAFCGGGKLTEGLTFFALKDGILI